jgi:hypothetical protein
VSASSAMPDEQPFLWDLAFGPDAPVIARFTNGAAGTTAPPRPKMGSD